MEQLGLARIISVLVWLTVAGSRLPNIIRILSGKARHYDALWSIIGAFGFVSIGFNLRWLLANDSQTLWLGLYIFSASVGLWALRVMRSYDDGAQ